MAHFSLNGYFRETVRDIMDILLPGELRTRKGNRLSRRTYSTTGPNHVVHVDQYDKLASFGFFIHGAIDGFSRKLLWLSVGNTNRNSSTILHFYLSYLKSIGGIPKLLRSDAGTENSLMLDVHAYIHEYIGSDHRPYIIGRSVHNQRIERFWGYLRSHFTQFWMDLFHDMLKENLYNPNNEIQFQLLQFCFMHILVDQIKEVQDTWNHHRVRQTRGSNSRPGIPVVLYTVPELFDGHNNIKNVENDILDLIDNELGVPLREYGCSDDFAELCLDIMFLRHFHFPSTPEDALDLYGNMLNIFDNPDQLVI